MRFEIWNSQRVHRQRADGSWVPLWFGNQFVGSDENPTYGTARVLHALTDLAGRAARTDPMSPHIEVDSDTLASAANWMLSAQNTDGSWGGTAGCASSIEETALAVEALAGVLALGDSVPTNLSGPRVRRAMMQGVVWLVEQVESGAWREPSPIGFYFAKLWYFERLYPLIFTVGALGKVAAAAGTIQDQREVTK